MSLENYTKEYLKSLEKVREETSKKYPEETKMLFEFVDNWIDLFPKSSKFNEEVINSISGIILLNSWKLTNWLHYEIMCGKYLEAIRNLRFVFEGCVFAVIIEDCIETEVHKKWGSLSGLTMKTEIFKIWEECKRKRVYKNKKVDYEKINKLVTNFVDHNSDSSITNKGDYIELYSTILFNPKLYLSTSVMIENCNSFLKTTQEDSDKLRKLWRELSSYMHFSYQYLDVITEDPEFCLVEKINDSLFKSTLVLYFDTLDFLYAVLAWRFQDLRNKIRELCQWWKDNFNNTFVLTEKVLKNMGEE